MRKEIKRYGDSAVITLSPEDLRVYGLAIEDVIDIELVKIKKKENKQCVA